MWFDKFLILLSFCVGITFGLESNSTVFVKSGNNNSTNLISDRIVGGKLIDIEQVPYQISLYSYGNFICGGSIISADWVLTAAHCVYDGGSFSVRAGTRYIGRDEGQFRLARTVVFNLQYNPYTNHRDVALIRVGRPFKWTAKVQPVFLAGPFRKLPPKYFVSGWGTQKENGTEPSYELRGVIVEKIHRKRCRAFYAQIGSITKNMICAALSGKDACQGDSGGPLTFKDIQYGIVSFGIGCARPKNPGVYTDVRKEFMWIRKTIRRYGGKIPRIM